MLILVLTLYPYVSANKTDSLHQLQLKDCIDPRESFLYQLSNDPTISNFKRVLLFGSKQDQYTPFTSALVDHTDKSLDSEGAVFLEEIKQRLWANLSRTHVETYLVDFPILDPKYGINWQISDVLGRKAHLAFLEDKGFCEMVAAIINV